MADLYLTLVTGSSVTLADLGNYVIPAGTTDMPTSQIADDSELAESTSWSSSLAAGEFTLTDLSGDPVTEVVAIGNTSNTFYGTQTYIGPVTGSSFTGSFVGDGSELTGIASTFGSQYHYDEDLSEQTTTSESYVNALTFTTSTVPSGTYRVGWSYEWKGNTGKDFEARLQIDNSTTLMEVNMEAKDNNNWYGVGGFGNVTFGSNDTHLIDFDFATEKSDRTMRIRNLRLEFYRVS